MKDHVCETHGSPAVAAYLRQVSHECPAAADAFHLLLASAIGIKVEKRVGERVVNHLQEKHVLRGTLNTHKAAQQGSKGGTTRMLAAYLDAGARIEMQGNRQKIDADLRGLRIETQTNVSRKSKVSSSLQTCPEVARLLNALFNVDTNGCCMTREGSTCTLSVWLCK